MKSIRNSRFFPILTVLCLFLYGLVWAAELVTVIAVIGAIAGVISLGWMVAKAINKAIKNRNKKLAELEADLKKLEDKIEASEKKRDKIKEDIDELEPIVLSLNSSWYTAELALDAAFKAVKTAQTEVDNTSKAYKASFKAWSDHIETCSQYMTESGCHTEYVLGSQQLRDKDSWDHAKRRLDIAETDRDEKASAFKTEGDKYKKANNKLTGLRRDKTNQIESLALLLDDEKALNQRIADKKTSIGEATTDASTVESARTAAPEYMESFEAARAAGEDMDQWVKDNPPPDSIKQFVDIMSKY